MKTIRMYAILVLVVVFAGVSFAQEMSKSEWEQEVNRYTQLRNELQTKLQQLNNEISGMQGQVTTLNGDINKCMDALYALVGSDATQAAAYRAEIEAAEQKAAELMRLSDADLFARKNEVDALAAKAKQFRTNKLSLIPEFSDKLDGLDQSIASLQRTIAGYGRGEYTVVRNDNLWNIAKKRDIYNNAWLWPKIWQANTDKIKNPDLIYPNQRFSVPGGSALDANEKAAANRYYAKKRQEGA